MNDLNGKLVTVFGGGGFIGRYVVQALCDAGARVRVAVRQPTLAGHVKPLGNLGQVSLCAADVTKPGTVANALAGADMAVNLVGAFDNMDAIQRVGAEIVAQCAAKANGQRIRVDRYRWVKRPSDAHSGCPAYNP
jgi:NADH dehydrogenase